MSFDKMFDLTAGVHFFLIIYVYSFWQGTGKAGRIKYWAYILKMLIYTLYNKLMHFLLQLSDFVLLRNGI